MDLYIHSFIYLHGVMFINYAQRQLYVIVFCVCMCVLTKERPVLLCVQTRRRKQVSKQAEDPGPRDEERFDVKKIKLIDRRLQRDFVSDCVYRREN
jgi:hypothetical protein